MRIVFRLVKLGGTALAALSLVWAVLLWLLLPPMRMLKERPLAGPAFSRIAS